MSERYPGGFMTQSPPTPSATNTTGVWTLDQQQQLKQSGQWPPNGPFFIEDLFSTWLYTGNGSTQTITNGIDLAGKGGLVWAKRRNYVGGNVFYDTVRGATKLIVSNQTNAESTNVDGLTAFNSNGFSLGSSYPNQNVNGDDTYVSWTFREQPKFFDVVTYTGDGSSSGKVINHNLGSIPGAVIIKRTDSTSDWWAQVRRSDGQYAYGLRLNSTAAQQGLYTPTSGQLSSTQFSNFIADDPLATNTNGATYVAYLFAHNAGGFGLTGTDNVISCGSFTTDGSGNATVDLGYEPQWVMTKRTNSTGGWNLYDNMRGWANGGDDQYLQANSSAAEQTFNVGHPTATGMYLSGNSASSDYIYIAIRRGPMRTPTSGTSVFSPNTQTGAGTSAGQTITTNFPVDLEISSGRSDNSGGNAFVDRLRGGQNYIQATNTNAEVNFTSWTPLIGFANNTGITDANYGSTSASYVAWNFRRAPGFFDEVCWTGTGSYAPQNHNLTVTPELVIQKARTSISGGNDWFVNTATQFGYLNLTNSFSNFARTLTPTTFQPVADGSGNWVTYLFASCPGVSKVGSYTGTGTTQTINCGFTGGARFVLIKRTDSTGDWYVWDTARGMIPANDPYLLLNSTAAEVTGTDFVDTAATGFEITSTAPAAINASGGTFIFLAIA